MSPPKTSKPQDPRALNVQALCRDQQLLEGRWPLAVLQRLQSSLADAPIGDVTWSAQGEQRAVAGADPEFWLQLRASAEVTLQCQRCLQPMKQPVDVDRRFRFVRSEDEAARLDEEIEDDVLVLTPRLDLLDLAEDELILALPLVPRHEVCPDPLPVAADAEAAAEEEAANPFAALAALRGRVPPR